MYGGIGNCLRNFAPCIWFALIARHNFFSASVWFTRSRRASRVNREVLPKSIAFPSTYPSPRGEGICRRHSDLRLPSLRVCCQVRLYLSMRSRSSICDNPLPHHLHFIHVCRPVAAPSPRGEGGGEGIATSSKIQLHWKSSSLQHFMPDELKHTLQISQHINIGEPDNLITTTL